MIDAILTATARALDRPERVVIAHFLSILPKIGLTEADVPPERLDALAAEAARTGQEDRDLRALALPVAPRRCAPFLRHGVPILLSTDSHTRETIGRYDHCLAVRRELAAALARRERRSSWILTAFVLAGALPLVAGCYQFALAGAAPLPLRATHGAARRARRTSRSWSRRGTRRP